MTTFIPETLFFSGPVLAMHFRTQLEGMKHEVQSTAARILSDVSESDFINNLVAKYSVSAPVLHMNQATKDSFEANVPAVHPSRNNARAGGRFIFGTVYNLEIPYTGSRDFFFMLPRSSPIMDRPEGYEKDGRIVITIYGDERLDAAKITEWFQRQPKIIQQYLDQVSIECTAFNSDLQMQVTELVKARYAKLRRDADVSAGIPFPLKERDKAPRTYAVPTIQRKITPPPPQPSETSPHPTLLEDHYKHILSVIEQMTNVMERSPKAFQEMHEEGIRNHYLVQLNGHYEGQATGETFNFEGKTDILIKFGTNALFVAEVKFWTGPKIISETIDQILRYVTWRDTKTAIILLSRNKRFSSVVSEAVDAMKRHPNYSAGPTKESETRFRLQFKNRDDPSREFVLTLILFDVPAKA